MGVVVVVCVVGVVSNFGFWQRRLVQKTLIFAWSQLSVKIRTVNRVFSKNSLFVWGIIRCTAHCWSIQCTLSHTTIIIVSKTTAGTFNIFKFVIWASWASHFSKITNKLFFPYFSWIFTHNPHVKYLLSFLFNMVRLFTAINNLVHILFFFKLISALLSSLSLFFLLHFNLYTFRLHLYSILIVILLNRGSNSFTLLNNF